MPGIGFVVPLLPGKREVDRGVMRSCWDGERRASHRAARARLGITREAVWIQPTPAGDVAVVYMEADDLPAALEGMAASQEPFDRWFREHVRDVHGVDLEGGMAPPELILDYRAGED